MIVPPPSMSPHHGLMTMAWTAVVVGGSCTCYYYYYYKLRPVLTQLSQVGAPSLSLAILQFVRRAWVRPILLEAPPPSAKQEEEEEALLVLLPDDRVPPEAYLDLAQLIQQKAQQQVLLRLHVGIARFGGNRPSAFWGDSDAHANVAVLLQQLNKKRRVGGTDVEHVILFGHGRGTETVVRTAPYTALIRFGSLTGIPSLESYPKPCLTLLGDRDRHVPWCTPQLASLLDQVTVMAKESNQTDHVPVPKPILLIAGLNRVCLVNPQQAKAYLTRQNDLPLHVQPAVALDLVACVTANFMAIVLGGTAAQVGQVTQLSRVTLRHLKPYRGLVAREAQIDFVQRLQQHIYYSSGNTNDKDEKQSNPQLPPISVQFSSDLCDFVYAKPEMGPDYLQTFLFESSGRPLKTKDGHVILTSPTWVIKCRSRQALLSTYSPASAMPTHDDNFSRWTHIFQEWNRQTFDHVLRHVVTSEERSRFVANGLRLEFQPDQQYIKRSSLPWIFSDLIVYENPADRTLVVATPAGYTSLENPKIARKFRGMHYGKVLSPAQCYEWIVSGCWRYYPTRSIRETEKAPPGFALTHEAVSSCAWEEIRTWLDLNWDDQQLDPGNNNTHNIPWEMSTASQNRWVAQFGSARYDYVHDRVVVDRGTTTPLPNVLQQLLRNDTHLTTDTYTQCIINVYDGASHIPWHVDDPAFGPTVIVYTFGQDRPLYLRRRDGRGTYTHYTAHPRHLSRYVLSEEARDVWEHSIPNGGTDWRISITFRSLRVTQPHN